MKINKNTKSVAASTIVVGDTIVLSGIARPVVMVGKGSLTNVMIRTKVGKAASQGFYVKGDTLIEKV